MAYRSIVLGLTCLVFWFHPSLTQSEVEYEGPIQVTLYHNLKENEFDTWEELSSIKIFDYNANPRSVVTGSISGETKDKIQSLAENDTLYRVKAIIAGTKGDETEYLFYTKLSCFSGCIEKIPSSLNIYLGSAGEVMGFTLSACGECNNSPRIIKPIVQGPTPDTTSYLQKLEKERDAKERGVLQDNRSFLSKYWFYILPIFVLLVVTGGPIDQSAQGQAASGSGGGAGGSQGR